MTALADSERQLLLDNPDLFLLHYFPHRLEKLEEFHLRLVSTATTEPRGLILYPAAHGKTTLVSTLLPIWALCKDPNIRIAIIAKNDIDAKAIMKSIHAELLGNFELIRDFGPFQDPEKPWAETFTSVAKRTRRGKESTLAAFGAGSRNALGYRCDWAICDDVVTDKNSATPEQRAKLKMWFMQGPRTMAEHSDDRLTVVGTLFDPEDLYADLIDLVNPETGEPIWHVQREDAIVEICFCGRPLADHDLIREGDIVKHGPCPDSGCEMFAQDDHQQVTLWTARWPWLRLMELKAEMGTLDFNKRLRNIAVDKSRMVFREEYIKGGYIGKDRYPGCLDKSYIIGEHDPSWRLHAGFDPAIGLTRSRKFCVHITLAVGSCREHEKCFWVVDIVRDQLTLPQQVELILQKHEQYGCMSSWIEANSYQLGLYQAIKDKMDERDVAYRIDPHYTTRTNKPDPEIGVHRMAPWFENGKVHIPWGNQESQRKMRQLVDELVQYPSGRFSDSVMATWIAWLAADVAAPRFQSYNRLRKKPFWAKTTSRRTVRNPYYDQKVEADAG